MPTPQILKDLAKRFGELRRSPRTPQRQEMVKREIESTDGRIDRLVFELSPEKDDMGWARKRWGLWKGSEK